MAPLVLEAFFHEALDNSGSEASLTRFLPDGIYFQVCGARRHVRTKWRGC
jgi:hypothetical protein